MYAERYGDGHLVLYTVQENYLHVLSMLNLSGCTLFCVQYSRKGQLELFTMCLLCRVSDRRKASKCYGSISLVAAAEVRRKIHFEQSLHDVDLGGQLETSKYEINYSFASCLES